jgi:hypothetical protein
MSGTAQFVLETELGDIPLTCNEAEAPRTIAALRHSVPMASQLHTPKIAGSHVYWHAPFVCDLEGSSPVMDMAAGAFFYWPDRQFLEISFAPLQAETATVTPIGQADCPVDMLVELGQRLRLTQGRAPNAVRLRATGPAPTPLAEPETPLTAIRHEIWAAIPDEIAALPARRAIMHPLGPMLYAEGDARNLHELLWWVRQQAGGPDAKAARFGAALLADKVATRLRDFCHLERSALMVDAIGKALRDPHLPADKVLEESILIAGRLAAWLDQIIRWNDLNETLVSQVSAS